METMKTAINLVSKDCYMSTIDWKNAYYSVPIHPSHRKYLRFMWNSKMYQYCAFPNGLSSAPRIFTKIAKVFFSQLRKNGYVSTSYIDDSLLFGETLEDCKENVTHTVRQSMLAGFMVHPEKSRLFPSKEVIYLGFVIHSAYMTIRLTPSKALKLKQYCQMLLKKNNVTLRQLATAVRLMVSSLPAVSYGQIYYRL